MRTCMAARLHGHVSEHYSHGDNMKDRTITYSINTAAAAAVDNIRKARARVCVVACVHL